jgi:hypothetical protein
MEAFHCGAATLTLYSLHIHRSCPPSCFCAPWCLLSSDNLTGATGGSEDVVVASPVAGRPPSLSPPVGTPLAGGGGSGGGGFSFSNDTPGAQGGVVGTPATSNDTPGPVRANQMEAKIVKLSMQLHRVQKENEALLLRMVRPARTFLCGVVSLACGDVRVRVRVRACSACSACACSSVCWRMEGVGGWGEVCTWRVVPAPLSTFP